MATKARADAPICYVVLGGAEKSQCPKNRLADAAPLLGKAASSQYMHLTYCCTKLTDVHTYTLLSSSNGHFEGRGPMERKDGAGEQLFCIA